MSNLEKLLERVRNNPKTVRFEEVDKILRRAGFDRRQPAGGSSDYVYTKGASMLTVPKENPYAKEVYVRRALELFDEEVD